MNVELIAHPTDHDWMEVKRRALVTVGKKPINPPDMKWKRAILTAAHSPIRRLMFSFYIECPSYVATHLARHVHAQPYIKTQRTDRTGVDRHELPQDAQVCMIWDINAEELIQVARKRLCNQADSKTQQFVAWMCELVKLYHPEFDGLLVPMCEYLGRCPEMYPCSNNN